MRRAALLVFFTALAAGAQEIYDLLIRGGHVIDPKNRRNERLDVAVIGERIARVGRDLPAAHARNVIDAGGYYVTPGLIDLHAHFDAQGAWFNLDPDHNSLRHGVTTAVDAGSTGWRTFEAFKQRVIDRARTRLLAFLDITASGASCTRPPDQPEEADVEAAVAILKKYPAQLAGIRVTYTPEGGWRTIERALEAAGKAGKPVMAVFRGQDPAAWEELVTRRLRSGDLLTHTYGLQTPLARPGRELSPALAEARRRGVLFDVGHGAAGFWFRVAAPALAQGFLPDVISTDLDKESVLLPAATLTNVISEFLNLGLTLEQVIERTTVRPAQAIGHPELGTLDEGAVADIALFALERGQFAFLDSGRAKLTGDRRLRCALTVRAGKVVWDADGLDAEDWREAGPYSNFK